MTGAQGVFKGTLCTTRGGWRYVRTRYGLLIKAAVACFDLYRRLSRVDLYIRMRAGDWLCPLFNSALSPREIMVVNQMVPGLIRNTGNRTSVDICGFEIWFLLNKYLDNMYVCISIGVGLLPFEIIFFWSSYYFIYSYFKDY